MNITVEALYKTFQNPDKEVLKDINLEIAEGEFLCLLGPSGCGKSTLLNIIAGLDTPTSGTVKFGGELITGPGPDRVMIFQESALFPWLSVVDNVKFGLKIAKVSDKEAEERAMAYLQKVNLASCRDYKISQLSGGMKQRVAIARALALNSKALLMDEPFAALDKQTKNLLRDELERLWLSEKRTVVYVTHSVEEALFFGDRVVMMSADPGVIKSIFKIDFPRPRQIDTPAFVKLRHDILADLRVEVERYEK